MKTITLNQYIKQQTEIEQVVVNISFNELQIIIKDYLYCKKGIVVSLNDLHISGPGPNGGGWYFTGQITKVPETKVVELEKPKLKVKFTCSSAKYHSITLGKIYEVESEYRNYYDIIDDNGHVSTFNKNIFTIVIPESPKQYAKFVDNLKPTENMTIGNIYEIKPGLNDCYIVKKDNGIEGHVSKYKFEIPK